MSSHTCGKSIRTYYRQLGPKFVSANMIFVFTSRIAFNLSSVLCTPIVQTLPSLPTKKHQSPPPPPPPLYWHLCEGTLPVTYGFFLQRAINARNTFVSWRHHEMRRMNLLIGDCATGRKFQMMLRIGTFIGRKSHMFCVHQKWVYWQKKNIHRYANLEHSKRHDGKYVAFVFELCFSGRPKRAKHPCDRSWGHCANDCTLLVVPDRCLVFTIKNTLSVIAVGRQTLLSQSSRRGTEPRRFLFNIA